MFSKKLVNQLVVTLSLILFSSFVHAEETTMEKVETGANHAADSVKKTYRDAKDKACEMVNGKLECAGKKIKNKAKNLKDKTETKATELKNKID